MFNVQRSRFESARPVALHLFSMGPLCRSRFSRPELLVAVPNRPTVVCDPVIPAHAGI